MISYITKTLSKQINKANKPFAYPHTLDRQQPVDEGFGDLEGSSTPDIGFCIMHHFV